MKYTTTVLALAVVTAKSVDGQRRNFQTVKGQMRRRELQGSMSMLTEYKGTGTTTTSTSSDETESCAELLTGSWIPSGSLCILQSIDGNSISKTCDADEDYEYSFSPDPEDDTLILTRGTAIANFIGFYNDAPCTFSAVSTASSTQITGELIGKELKIEVLKSGDVGSPSVALAFKGSFVKKVEPEPKFNLSGRYFGQDTQDGSTTTLYFNCGEKTCDITLGDPEFSTCTGTGSGVAFARDIPRDQLDDFMFELYCLKEGETEIDIEGHPTSHLVGNLIFLSDRTIRRTGTGFLYTQTSNAMITDKPSFSQNQDQSSLNLNGRYVGVDPRDGSAFGLSIFCEKRSCDIDLLDTSWATCRSINSLPFFGGTAVARNVPQDSLLNNFNVKLYCLLPGAFEVDIDDPTLEPDAIIPLSLVSLREGILFSEPDFFYYLSSTSDNEFKQSSSTFASRLNGVDTEDGSGQSLELDLKCEERLCNITLSDSSFSTCIEQTGDFLGGCAIAKDVSEDSLDDFELELFCLADGQTEIDYEGEPVAKLPGNLEFLDDGIIKRTATGFVYFNSFYPEIKADLPAVISNGLFRGTNTQDGGEDILTLWCSNDSCEINLQAVIFSRCIALTGKFSVFNGIGIARNVPEDSLDDFEIEVYCVPDPGQTVDIDVVSPSYTIKAGMVPIFSISSEGGTNSPGVVLQTESDFVFYKASPE